MATNSNALTLKLVIDTKANKVLFAEANKEAVDFLSSLLALPTGTVIKLLAKEPPVKKYYKCINSETYAPCRSYITDVYDYACPNAATCRGNLRKEITFIGQTSLTENAVSIGFVKGMETYTVMEDLSVFPMSSTSTVTMLNKFEAKDIASLKEKYVDLDIKLALKLLKASLQSKTVFTDVFVSNKYN